MRRLIIRPALFFSVIFTLAYFLLGVRTGTQKSKDNNFPQLRVKISGNLIIKFHMNYLANAPSNEPHLHEVSSQLMSILVRATSTVSFELLFYRWLFHALYSNIKSYRITGHIRVQGLYIYPHGGVDESEFVYDQIILVLRERRFRTDTSTRKHMFLRSTLGECTRSSVPGAVSIGREHRRK